MKTIKQIRAKIKELQEKIDDAEQNLNYKSIPDYATYRTLHTQINTLAWVLDEQRKILQ